MYDLQTNASMTNNVFLFGDQVSVAWNEDLSPFATNPFIRNAYYDGSAWIAQMDSTGLTATKWPKYCPGWFQ